MSVVVFMLYGTILVVGSLTCGFQTALGGTLIYLFAKSFYGGHGYGINPYLKLIPQLAYTVVFGVFSGFVITLISDAGLSNVLEINKNGFLVISLLLSIPDFYKFNEQHESIKRTNEYINSATDANHMRFIHSHYPKKI